MKDFHYTDCGLDNIYLINGFEIIETKEGEEILIHDINGLHKTIGMILISKPGMLSGQEIRFIRHTLDLSQKALASIIGVDYQTILRWEKNETPIRKTADRFIRAIFYCYVNKNGNTFEKINEIADLDSNESTFSKVEKIKFEETAHEWRRSA